MRTTKGYGNHLAFNLAYWAAASISSRGDEGCYRAYVSGARWALTLAARAWLSAGASRSSRRWFGQQIRHHLAAQLAHRKGKAA